MGLKDVCRGIFGVIEHGNWHSNLMIDRLNAEMRNTHVYLEAEVLILICVKSKNARGSTARAEGSVYIHTLLHLTSPYISKCMYSTVRGLCKCNWLGKMTMYSKYSIFNTSCITGCTVHTLCTILLYASKVHS